MDTIRYFCSGGSILLVLLLSGCNNPGTERLQVRYTAPVLDSCRNEPDHHYLISEPENVTAQSQLPLILVIDPHGDGRLATDNFLEALADIPAVIAGSDKIENNDPDFESSLSNLMDDVLAKYPADPEKVIVAGFSGGARMAYYYGVNHNVLGIIMFGAGPGGSDINTGGKRIYMVSGTRDFNFMEQYLPPFKALYDNGDYMADYFRGTHEWPPPERIYESVTYILKDAPNFPESIPQRISERMLTEYDILRESGDLFFAAQALAKAWVFSAKNRRKDQISRMINDFQNMPGWISYNQTFEGYMQQEVRLKQAYLDHLADPDTTWWKREIQSLNQRISSGFDPETEDLLYRLKGFIGIVLYSQINNLIQRDLNSPVLDRLLDIYELAEPDSPDLISFKQRLKQRSRK